MRRPCAVGVQCAVERLRPERGRVGDDGELGACGRERAQLVVDDQPARSGEIHDARLLRLALPEVVDAVQQLQRPGAQHEQRERGERDRRDDPDAAIEGEAVEVALLDGRHRLDERARPGKEAGTVAPPAVTQPPRATAREWSRRLPSEPVSPCAPPMPRHRPFLPAALLTELHGHD